MFSKKFENVYNKRGSAKIQNLSDSAAYIVVHEITKMKTFEPSDKMAFIKSFCTGEMTVQEIGEVVKSDAIYE